VCWHQCEDVWLKPVNIDHIDMSSFKTRTQALHPTHLSASRVTFWAGMKVPALPPPTAADVLKAGLDITAKEVGLTQNT